MKRAAAPFLLALLLGALTPILPAQACSRVAGIEVSDCDDDDDEGGSTKPKGNKKKKRARSSSGMTDSPSATAMLLAELNAARAARGVPRLATHGIAASIARSHARAMARRGTVYHNPALGSSWLKATLGWPTAHAENVGYAQSPRSIHRAFMRSRGHSHNILNPVYDHVGVAVVKDGRYYYAVELFLGGARSSGGWYRSGGSGGGSRGGGQAPFLGSRVVRATALLEAWNPPASIEEAPVATQAAAALPWGMMTLGLSGMLLPSAARAVVLRRRRSAPSDV